MTTSYTWSPVDADATRMTLRNHGEPAGFSRLTAPLVSFAMRRAMTEDLAKLAEILGIALSVSRRHYTMGAR